MRSLETSELAESVPAHSVERLVGPSRPKALDLYCCAGGAGTGLHRAGYNVTGMDIVNQPNYPFAFLQGDALDADLSGFDFVWASPPCQNSSRMSGCRPGLAEQYAQLIPATRSKLKAWVGPWIIENVVGAPLENPVMLCGAMFGLQTYRHRIFESNVPLTAPPHPKHDKPTSKAGHWEPGTLISVAGNCAPMPLAREAMGMDWTTRAELVEAIPPVFAEYLARQILRVTARPNDKLRHGATTKSV
jgi:DNA (cytosine-5)-methyltransferase 1